MLGLLKEIYTKSPNNVGVSFINKKAHECGVDGYLVIRPFHDIGCLIIVFNLAGAVRLISLKYIS